MHFCPLYQFWTLGTERCDASAILGMIRCFLTNDRVENLTKKKKKHKTRAVYLKVCSEKMDLGECSVIFIDGVTVC